MKKHWLFTSLIAGALALTLSGCSDPTYPPKDINQMTPQQVQTASQNFINAMKEKEKKGQALTEQQNKEMALAIKDNMTSTIEVTAKKIKTDLLGNGNNNN